MATPFFKDLPKLVLVFVLVMGVSGLAASLLTPHYYAEALLYVRYGREYTYRSDTGGAEMSPQNFEAKQALKAEAKLLGAPELVEQAVDRIGIATLYPDLVEARTPGPAWLEDLKRRLPNPAPDLSPRDAAIKRLMSSMHAEAGDDGNVIAVSVAHPDPAIATRTLDALITAYMTSRRALFSEQRAVSLRPEVDAARARLAEAEKALTSYRAKNGIVSFDSQRAELLARRSETQSMLAAAETERNGLADRLARLQKTLAKTPATLVLESSSGDSAALDNARQTLLQLKLEERRLLSEYKEKSPNVIEIRARIAQAERFLTEVGKKPVKSTRTGRNSVYDALSTQIAGVEGDLAAADSRRQVLKQQLAETNERLVRLDANTGEFTRFSRDLELAEQTYRLLAGKLEETKVLDEVAARDGANVRVAQQARAWIEPNDPRPLVLGLGFVAALVASVLAGLLSDILRRGFLTTDDLERETGLPVLAAFPTRRIRPWTPGLAARARRDFDMEGR